MSNRLPPKHAEKELARIRALSNGELLEEAFQAAPGDDYDGCFTKAGKITYDILREELNARLAVWLKGKKKKNETE